MSTLNEFGWIAHELLSLNEKKISCQFGLKNKHG